MKVYLNGHELDFTLENETNAGQVLDQIETLAEENNATIVHIQINGETVPAEEIEKCYSMALDTVDAMQITTVQQDDIVVSLKDLEAPVTEIAAKLEQIPVLLQHHKDGEVAEILKRFADSFDSMCQLAALSSLFPARFQSLQFSNLNFQDYLKDFSPILSQFEEALKSGDTVLTGDLAEWELKPRLDQFIESIKEFN